MAARKAKSFTSSVNKEKIDRIPFELLGEEFEAYGTIPGAVLLDFIGASDENSGATARGILVYLETALPASEFKRFDKLIRDPENNVELEVLSEIVSFLVEEQTSRPTTAS
jgi:hypothetical protein